MLYIHAFLVVRLYGLMSIFFDNSFFTLMSPSSVFCIRWIVIEDIRSAILCTAIFTSGLSDSLVYPGTPKSSNAPCSLSHFISPGSALFLLNILPILFIKLTYSPPFSHLLAVPDFCRFFSICIHEKTEASNKSILCVGSTFSYFTASSVCSIALTFCRQYS